MSPIRTMFPLIVSLCLWGAAPLTNAAESASLQAVIDANPGRMVHVPDGDHLISQRLRITGDGGGLYGYGKIIQSNPAEPVLEIEHAANVRIEGITLTRAEGQQDATAPGLLCRDVKDTVISGVRVIECRARDAAIHVRECSRVTVRDCVVRNYKRIAIDDRTDSELYGYAFHCIDGTGLLVERSTGSIIDGNRIVEERLLPTPELKEEFKLGTLADGKKPTKPGQLGTGAVSRGYVSNWHQGSAVVVTSPEDTRNTIVRGNCIENAAQGIDLHCDNAIISQNIVDHGMMGIKLTHGCRNVTVSDNLLTHIDLWGILVNPGAASHAAEPATGAKAARAANVDAGIIIANNQITSYGFGHEYWNHGGATDDQGGSYAIALFEGQLETNPPLADVIITGNVVYDTGRDGEVRGDKTEAAPPRYRYAVYVGPWGETGKPGPTYPKNLHFSNNLLHPGTRGVSNVEGVY